MQKERAQFFFIEPMECRPVEKLPEGDDWQHEIKFDGYRAIALKQRGEVELFSRRGNSFNAAYPGIVTALLALRAQSFVLDGELVAIDKEGRYSFSFLQNAKRRARGRADQDRINVNEEWERNAGRKSSGFPRTVFEKVKLHGRMVRT